MHLLGVRAFSWTGSIVVNAKDAGVGFKIPAQPVPASDPQPKSAKRLVPTTGPGNA